MDFHCWNEEGCTVELDEREKQAYIDYVQKKNPGQQIKYITVKLDEREKQAYIDYVQKKNPGQQIKSLIVKLDGDYVDLKYEVVPIPFQRIRRITGYLSEVKQFNDAKQDELKDRVKHC